MIEMDFRSQTAPNPKEWHFAAHFYALLARMLDNLRRVSSQSHGDERLSGLFNTHRFLNTYADHLERMTGQALGDQDSWWDAHLKAFEKNNPQHLPLRALREDGGFSPVQIDLLLITGLVEEDIRFGTLFAQLQAPLPQRYPCLGLLGFLMSTLNEPLDDAWLLARPLVEANYINVLNAEEPRAEWALRAPIPVWDALRGRAIERPLPGVVLQPRTSFPALESLIFPEATHYRLRGMPALILSGEVEILAMRGLLGSGRRTTLGSLARALNRDALVCETLSDDAGRILGPLATLTGGLPILRINPGPNETFDLPDLKGYRGTIGVTMGKSGGIQAQPTQRILTENLPSPNPEARRRFWENTDVLIVEEDFDLIVRQFVLTGGLIQRVAAMAEATAHLELRTSITVDDVQSAARSLNRQMLDTLATSLEPLEGWKNLVVSPSVRRELGVLEMRCTQREHLQEATGPAYRNNLNRGVRAMFSGPSGTGKTLGARALAAALKKDIYRINLDATVSKYIGDTPRNLNEVFSAAESLDVVLLADEGDGLMTRRTDVSSSNDRYANLETNYLLQRLEVYEGIIIITTNAAQRIDSAFLRRLDVVVEFTRPESEERLALWQAHLPTNHRISDEALEQTARSVVLTGGQIRNATLYMAMLALKDGEAVNEKHLQLALEREYRKAGMSSPTDSARPVGKQGDRLKRLNTLLNVP